MHERMVCNSSYSLVSWSDDRYYSYFRQQNTDIFCISSAHQFLCRLVPMALVKTSEAITIISKDTNSIIRSFVKVFFPLRI